jgi:hypothetical protein
MNLQSDFFAKVRERDRITTEILREMDKKSKAEAALERLRSDHYVLTNHILELASKISREK